LGKKSEGNPSVSRPAGRPFFPTREQGSLSVYRDGRPDPTESKALAGGRSPSRPKCTQCTLVHVGRPTEQSCSAYGRPASRPTLGQKLIVEIFLKPIFFRQNKL